MHPNRRRNARLLWLHQRTRAHEEIQMRTAVVTGNPKPKSRTLEAAVAIAADLGGGAPQVVVDVVSLGAGLLGWGDPAVKDAIELVRTSAVVIVASPTYKSSYTGLLKLFLDQIPTDGLAGVIAVPLMLGAGPGHAMAPEVFLKPVLVELGATCPTRALYLLESDYDNPPAWESWLTTAKAQVVAAMGVAT
jgi:FMN reductase